MVSPMIKSTKPSPNYSVAVQALQVSYKLHHLMKIDIKLKQNLFILKKNSHQIKISQRFHQSFLQFLASHNLNAASLASEETTTLHIPHSTDKMSSPQRDPQVTQQSQLKALPNLLVFSNKILRLATTKKR